MPEDLKTWLTDRAKHYGTSLNSEIVRVLRERMDSEDRAAT
jgi:plasmid stability protein